MIDILKTNESLPNVRGGYHDAADFDRRDQHFGIVSNLVHTYLMYLELYLLKPVGDMGDTQLYVSALFWNQGSTPL